MKRKQFFSALLCAMMMMTLAPTPALAAGAVAEIVGGAQYATVQDAIDAAADGATIRLLDNVSLQPESSGPYTLEISEINLTIDLNGKTITGMGPTAIDHDTTLGNTLTITDNSTSGGGVITSSFSSPISSNGNVTVSGGVVQSSSAPTIYTSGGTVTISGGTVRHTTGWAPTIQAETVIVSGGTVSSNNSACPTIVATSVTVSGGTVSSDSNDYPTIGADDVIVSGGSINNSIASATPRNAATTPVEVKLYTLTLAGVSSETVVTSLTLTPALGYTYGLTDVTTDASGKLYVWLPDAQSAASVSVTANGKIYKGTVSGYVATLTATYDPGTSSSDPPPYSTRTLTDETTGLTVSGTLRSDATLHINSFTPAPNTTDPALAAIRKRMDSTTDKLIFCADITISGNYSGPLTLSCEVGDQYNGQTVTLLHAKNGTLTTYTAIVINGIATFTVTSLSPFALFAPAINAVSIPQTGDSGTPNGTIAAFGILALITGITAVHNRRKYKKEKAN